MISRAASWVDSRSRGQAEPSFTAANHVRAQTHHESPGFKPGKPCCGAGVIRSFPCRNANSRNDSVTTQHTVWLPKSRSSVLHFPSLYQPVMGSQEQSSSGWPNTLRLGNMPMPTLPMHMKACPISDQGGKNDQRACFDGVGF